MYRCKAKGCNAVTELGQPANRVVLETREKLYEVMAKRKKYEEPRLVKGTEIVREIYVCPDCFTKMTGQEPMKRVLPIPEPKKKEPRQHRRPRKQKWDNKRKPKVEYRR